MKIEEEKERKNHQHQIKGQYAKHSDYKWKAIKTSSAMSREVVFDY
jgi:hypothetical protein